MIIQSIINNAWVSEDDWYIMLVAEQLFQTWYEEPVLRVNNYIEIGRKMNYNRNLQFGQ